MSKLTDWINRKLDTYSWGYNELARKAGLSSGTISNLMAERTRPGLDLCVGVARAFGEPPERILRLAKLLPSLPKNKAQDELILGLFHQLPPHLKEAALLMLRGLCGPPPLDINPTAQRLSLDLTQDADNTPQTETTEEMEKGSGKGGQQPKDNMARQAYSRFFDNYPLEVERVSQHLIALLQEAVEKQQAIRGETGA